MKRTENRRIRTVLWLLVAVTAVILFGGCEEAGTDGTAPTDGGVRVVLSGATGPVADNQDGIAAVLYAENEKSIYSASAALAIKEGTVGADGTASLVLMETDDDFGETTTPWTGTAGTTYDLYIYTDDDADGDYEPVTSDRAYRTASYPMTVTIDGDQNVAVDFADMVEYTGGTLEVTVTDDGTNEGKIVFFGVFIEGADPDVDDTVGFTENFTISAGTASESAIIDGASPWYGVDGSSYDLYVFIDQDGGGSNDGPTPGDLIYKETYTQDGDKTVTLDAQTDFDTFN